MIIPWTEGWGNKITQGITSLSWERKRWLPDTGGFQLSMPAAQGGGDRWNARNAACHVAPPWIRCSRGSSSACRHTVMITVVQALGGSPMALVLPRLPPLLRAVVPHYSTAGVPG